MTVHKTPDAVAVDELGVASDAYLGFTQRVAAGDDASEAVLLDVVLPDDERADRLIELASTGLGDFAVATALQGAATRLRDLPLAANRAEGEESNLQFERGTPIHTMPGDRRVSGVLTETRVPLGTGEVALKLAVTNVQRM